MRVSSRYFFSEYNVFEFIENRKSLVSSQIRSLEQDYLLNVNEEELVAALVDQFRLDVPTIIDDAIHIADHSETQVDVSRDPYRGITDRSRPFYVSGTTLTIAIPFEGNPQLFRVRPNLYSNSYPGGTIVDNEIHFVYTTAGEDSTEIETNYKRTVAEIKQYLDILRGFIENQFNNQLQASIREQVSQRKKKIIAGSEMVASLGLPIKRRDGAPTTYAIPLSRRKPKIELPRATSTAFPPEPILDLDEYEHILSIMKNMVSVMEQSPSAFEQMNEEHLRTQFLVQLNAQYEGKATAETFNYQGKTDILLRSQGKNVFIVECKFWKGAKSLTDAIDQLLSYLSWRDTKTAILLFNRNANLTKVLQQIVPIAKTHQCYKRDHPQKDETDVPILSKQPQQVS